MKKEQPDKQPQTFGDILKKPRIGRLYALVILLGLPALLIGGDILWREVHYSWFATTQTGQITTKTQATARKGQQIFKLGYSYINKAGNSVEKQAVVVKPNWDKYQKGDDVSVRVIAGKNNRSRLEFEATHHIVTGAIFLLLGMYVFVLVFLRLNSEKKHDRDGTFETQIAKARKRTHLLLWVTMVLFVIAQFL